MLVAGIWTWTSRFRSGNWGSAACLTAARHSSCPRCDYRHIAARHENRLPSVSSQLYSASNSVHRRSNGTALSCNDLVSRFGTSRELLSWRCDTRAMRAWLIAPAQPCPTTMPQVTCLVELIEMPFTVVACADILLVNLERVGFNLRNFDMTIIFKVRVTAPAATCCAVQHVLIRVCHAAPST